jgi:hypothetical protein
MTTPKNSTSDSIARQPAAASKPTGGAKTATVRYVDLPECGETFADAVNGVFFDGQTLRIEFGITRMDEVKKDAPVTGRRYPACRLVLPPAAAVELINRMQQIAAALEQAGIVKANRKDSPPAP